MARHIDSVCRLCRREGQKLFLKGDRCYSDKCAYDRRQYSPGQHGQSTGKISEFGQQLREKQKAKRLYGLLEVQFRNTFEKALRKKGVTGHNLLFSLERRLDNVCYRIGFANSRAEARQLLRHKHVTVNGKRVTSPSYQVRQGDKIEIKEKSRKIIRIQSALDAVKRRVIPDWLALDAGSFMGEVKNLPKREDIQENLEEHLIVEMYSR